MKRKISLLMAVIIVLGTFINPAAAAENAVPVSAEATDESKVLKLSMEDAVKLAIENDRAMWKLDDKIKEMQELRRSGSSAKDMAEQLMEAPLEVSSAMGVTNNYLDLLLSKNGYYIKVGDLKSEEIKKQREVLLLGIELGTKASYYGVLVKEKAIEINEARLSSANEQLRVVNLKFGNGSATKAEVLNGEMAVQKAKTDLDTAMDDLNIAKLNFLNQLNLPLDAEIVLTDKEIKYVPTSNIDLDKAIEKAKAERPEIQTAINDLEIQKIETHAYTAYYTSNLRQNKWAKEKLKDAELKVPQTYKDVELDVRSSYLDLIKNERNLVNMNKTVELAKEGARIKKLLYENGMATSLDVLDADTGLAEAEIGLYQIMALYNISKLSFDNSNLIGSMKAEQ